MCPLGHFESSEGIHLVLCALRQYSLQVVKFKLKFCKIGVFRFIYVCYADRGLVRQGRVELVLANLLYLVFHLDIIARVYLTHHIWPIIAHPYLTHHCPYINNFNHHCPSYLTHHCRSILSFINSLIEGVGQHCLLCILCNLPSASVLWQVKF